jgi:hypothetical protein
VAARRNHRDDIDRANFTPQADLPAQASHRQRMRKPMNNFLEAKIGRG